MTYYATLCQSHTHRINGVTVDADSVVAIDADDYTSAHEFANTLFGRKWCSLYKPHQLQMNLFHRGIVLALQAPKKEKDLAG